MFTVVDVVFFFYLLCLFGKTKTVYLPPAKEGVLKDLPDSTGSMKPAVCEAIKR